MNPVEIVNVGRKQVESMAPSSLSMMRLLGRLSEGDVLGLLVYVLTKGYTEDPLFKK